MSVKDIIKNLLIKAVRDSVPEADVTQGTALNDLLVEPNSVFLSDLFLTIGAVSDHLRIDENLSSEETLDAFAANWFLTRSVGVKSYGVVRLLLANAQNIFIGEQGLLIERNGVVFQNDGVFSLDISEVFKSRDNGFYYVDVPVVAQVEGLRSILSENSFVINLSPVPFTSCRAISDFYPGKDRETNEDFYERIKRTISLRNIVSPRSIENLMTEEFPWVDKVLTVGYGDPEMKRDAINLAEIASLLTTSGGDPVFAPEEFEIPEIENFHIGNKIDIYANYRDLVYDSVVLTPLETDFYSVYDDENYELDLSTLVDDSGNKRFHFPIYDIVGIQVLDENNEPISFVDDIVEELVDCSNPAGFTTGMYSWSSLTPKLRFSPKERIGLRLKSDLIDGEHGEDKTQLQTERIAIVYRYFAGFEEIQEYLDHSDNRLVSGDPLVKVFIPAKISVIDEAGEDSVLRVKLAGDNTVEDVEFFLVNYFRDLKTRFEISEVISKLHAAGLVSYVENPVLLKLSIPPLDRKVGYEGSSSILVDTSYFYDPDDAESEKYLTYFDLEELGEKGADFISEIEVEAI